MLWLQKVVFAAVVVFLGLLAFTVIIDNPYSHFLIKGTVNKELSKQAGIQLDFNSIRLGLLWSPHLELYGLTVVDRDGEQLLQTHRSAVYIGWWDLLFDRVELSKVEIHQPTLRIERLLALYQRLQPTEQPSDDTITKSGIVWPPQREPPLKEIAIYGARLDYRAPQAGGGELEITVRDAHLQLQLRNWNSVNGRLEVGELRSEADGEKLLHTDQLSVDVVIQGQSIRFDEIVVAGPHLQGQGQAHAILGYGPQESLLVRPLYRRAQEIRFESELELRLLDLQHWGEVLGLKDSAGSMDLDVALEGDWGLVDSSFDWLLHAGGQLKDGRIEGFLLHDTRLQASIDQEVAHFHDIVVEDDGKVFATGQGDLDFKPNFPFRLAIDSHDLTFRQLLEILTVDEFDVLDADLRGKGIQLRGQAKPFQLNIAGELLFTSLRSPWIDEALDLEPHDRLSCFLELDLRINPDRLRPEDAQGPCWAHPMGTDGLTLPGESPYLSWLELDGAIGFSQSEGLDLMIALEDFDGQLLLKTAGLTGTGRVVGDLRLQGPYDNLALTADLQSGELQVNGFKLATAEASITLPFNTSRLHSQRIKGNTAAGGSMVLRDLTLNVDSLDFSTELQFEEVEPEALSQGIVLNTGQPFSLGVSSLQGRLTGPLLKPFRYQGDLTMTLVKLQLDGQRLFDRVQGRWQGHGNSFRLTKSVFKAGNIDGTVSLDISQKKLAGSGLFPGLGLGDDDRLDIVLETFDVRTDERQSAIDRDILAKDHLRSLPILGPILSQSPLRGQLYLKHRLLGPYHRLQGQFEGAIRGLSVFGAPMTPLNFRGFTDGGKVDVAEITSPGQSVRGRFTLHLDQPGFPYQWFLSLKRYDIRPLLSSIFWQDPRNYAYLSANLDLTGDLLDFYRSKGRVNADTLSIKFVRDVDDRIERFQLRNEEPAEILITDQWRMEQPFRVSGDDLDFSLEFAEGMQLDDLQITFLGSMKMDLLRQLAATVDESRGTMNLHGEVGGSIVDPQLSFQLKGESLTESNALSWQPLELGIVDFSPALTGIDLDLAYDQGVLTINRFRAAKGPNSEVSATGTWGNEGTSAPGWQLLFSFDRATVDQVPIPVFNSADIVFSGQLAMTGQGAPYSLTGTLQLDQGQAVADFDLRQRILDSFYRQRYAPPRGYGPPLFELGLDVSADKTAVVKNRNLDAVFSANMRISGSEQSPALLGLISVEEGTFNYKREFSITRGSLVFDAPVYPPDPKLDIAGVTEIAPYQVRLSVSGSASDPTIDLLTDPPTRDDGTAVTKVDTIFLLNSGQLPDASRTTADVASAEAMNLVVGLAEKPIEKIFDLSGQNVIREVYIDTYLSEDRPVTRFNLPLRIATALNLVLQVDDDSNLKVSSEYVLDKQISVSGSFEQQGESNQSAEDRSPADTGVDLRFKFRFP